MLYHKMFGQVIVTLKYILLACGLTALVAYIVTASIRVAYPFELEWMEGGMVTHVLRILEGMPLYAEPSLDFTPYVYTPLYSYISVPATIIIGEGFLPLRLISFAASLLSFFMIFALIFRETGNRYSGIIGAGLFAATYEIGGAWFEIARPDTLRLLFFLLSIYFLRKKATAASLILAGTAASLAFWTKQTSLFIIFFMAVYTIYNCRAKSLYFICSAAIFIGGGSILANFITEGWYSYYVFFLPGAHSINLDGVAGILTKDIILTLPAAFAAFILFLFYRARNRSIEQLVFYLTVSIGVLGSSILGRVFPGSFQNVMIPTYAILAVFFGIIFNDTIKLLRERRQSNNLTVLFILIYISQFALLAYQPGDFIPSKQDRAAGDRLISEISDFDGKVLIPFHSYYGKMAGKDYYAHEMSLVMIFRADKETWQRLGQSIGESIRQKEFSAIFLDQAWFAEYIDRYYTESGHIFASPDLFFPSTGAQLRPENIYTPRAGD